MMIMEESAGRLAVAHDWQISIRFYTDATHWGKPDAARLTPTKAKELGAMNTQRPEEP